MPIDAFRPTSTVSGASGCSAGRPAFTIRWGTGVPLILCNGIGASLVTIRWGTGVPLILCNGIGASLVVLDPFVEQLDPDTTVGAHRSALMK